MNRRYHAALAALVLVLLAAPAVLAHEISKVEVRCGAGVVHAEGIKFDEHLPIVITLTGEAGYVRTYTATTGSWSHNFPLPPNGHAQIDWPDSGDFGPVPVFIDCAVAQPTPTPRPTPTVVGHTPRPERTLPPTDTEDQADPSTTAWGIVVLVGVTALVLAALICYGAWLHQRAIEAEEARRARDERR